MCYSIPDSLQNPLIKGDTLRIPPNKEGKGVVFYRHCHASESRYQRQYNFKGDFVSIEGQILTGVYFIKFGGISQILFPSAKGKRKVNPERGLGEMGKVEMKIYVLYFVLF